MAKCPNYRSEMVTIRTHATRSDRREAPPKRVLAGWCIHAASPFSKDQAMAGERIACGGDLGKCPIADKLA